jgi:hypothetical protein
LLFRGLAATAALAACGTLVTAGTSFAAPATTGESSSSAGLTIPTTNEKYRGELISVTPIRELRQPQVVAELTEAGFDPASARYGVRLYQLGYRTVDVHNQPSFATGLVVLPAGQDRSDLTTVSYSHGTQVFRGNAPSTTSDSWETAAPITYASAGFAVVAADYLGLGLGPGKHPWMHVPSEVTASVDLLRAARSFTARQGIRLRPDVLATGFSQGASVTVATAHALQDGAVPGFRLAALAPVSGAYDFRHSEIPALLTGKDLNETWSVAYLSYLFVSWNRLHQLYDDPAEVFKSPYDKQIPGLFDGEHPGDQVLPGLAPDVKSLLTDRGRGMLENPTGRFADALRVADATCRDWTPAVPVRLYATRTDEQAAFANTLACQAQLRESGTPAPIINVGDTDHADSNVRATADIVRWFLTR